MNTQTEQKNLAQLVLIARDLTGADYGDAYNNQEYVRGQVEMIMDFCGISTLYDENKDLVTRMIAEQGFFERNSNDTVKVTEKLDELLNINPLLSQGEAWVLACLATRDEFIEDDWEEAVDE